MIDSEIIGDILGFLPQLILLIVIFMLTTKFIKGIIRRNKAEADRRYELEKYKAETERIKAEAMRDRGREQ